MKKKIVSVCLVVCLLATAIIGTTLAYFTDTKTVTNTFSSGNVTITLDEADVNEVGQKLDNEGNVWVEGATLAARVVENGYRLYPGKTYTKDPTITVAADSEDCYVFVEVVNGLAGLEAEGNTIADQMAAKGWTLVDDETNVYKQTGTYGANDTVVVFETFTIDTAETATTLADAENVVITAYAVQAEGFGSAQEAWDAVY